MTPFPLFRLNRPVNVLQGSMQKVRPGTAASCFNETTDIVKIQKQKGEARYGGKLFNQDDRQSRDQ